MNKAANEPSEQVIEAMASCLLKTFNTVTREEVIAAWRVAQPSSIPHVGMYQVLPLPPQPETVLTTTHPPSIPRDEFMRLSVEAAMEVLERYPNLRALLQDGTSGLLSTELQILLYSVADYVKSLRTDAAPAEDDVLVELKRVAGGEPPETLRAIVILFAKALLVLRPHPMMASSSCPACGKLKLLPGVAYGIADEAICKC